MCKWFVSVRKAGSGFATEKWPAVRQQKWPRAADAHPACVKLLLFCKFCVQLLMV